MIAVPAFPSRCRVQTLEKTQASPDVTADGLNPVFRARALALVRKLQAYEPSTSKVLPHQLASSMPELETLLVLLVLASTMPELLPLPVQARRHSMAPTASSRKELA